MPEPESSVPRESMDRRAFVRHGLAASALVVVHADRAAAAPATPAAGAPVPAFALEEATIAGLQAMMRDGRASSRAITEQYLARIAQVDRGGPTVNAVLELNPDALEIAERLDAERRQGRVRGALHGVPVLLKDNIDTADRMRTSAGSLALQGASAPRDAYVVERLRAAGAVLLGKTNLSEWANFRSTRSSSGWSARGGQTRNPYALDRNPCGSSSGSGAAVAANCAAVAVGTETDGSIVCPSHANGLVGLKPTVGLVSRSGIIPISHTQDTAGPMTRTVTDAAVLLSAMTGRDARDPATARAPAAGDYAAALEPGALRGARIGVARQYFGFHGGVDTVLEEAVRAMREAGAVLVDPVTLAEPKSLGDAEFEVLLFEFKADVAAYLATRGDTAPHRTLSDLIAFNATERAREMPWFGQELFEQAERKGPLTSPAYRKALAACRTGARTRGLDATLARHRLEAIIAPTGGPAWVTDLVNGDHFGGGSSALPAIAGYPSITVPAGFLHGLPIGITFTAGAWQERTLLRLAYAFEQATRVRRAPRFAAHAGES
jgi:amidase